MRIGIAFLLVLCAPFWSSYGIAQKAQAPEIIAIDAREAGHPFPHFWEEMFGSGRAILTLRESYRNDLRAV
jgi:xylan 1,4-beta-xylosidase